VEKHFIEAGGVRIEKVNSGKISSRGRLYTSFKYLVVSLTSNQADPNPFLPVNVSN
jgi:hypothetical protein